MHTKNSHILVVDDSGTNLLLLQRLLEDEGHEVIALDNARDALKYLNDHQQVDLILLDIMMPEIDGFKFLEQIKQDDQLQSIPVIMVTAKNDHTSHKKALSLGAVGYMSKPLDLKKLRALIHEQLSRQD